jgi:hypothetical protein
MKVTNATVGRLCDQYVAIDNNHRNTLVGHLAVERALVPHYRNSHRLRYTFDGQDAREIRYPFRQRNPFAHDQIAYVQHDILDSDLARW